jgi:hypothetical protein
MKKVVTLCLVVVSRQNESDGILRESKTKWQGGEVTRTCAAVALVSTVELFIGLHLLAYIRRPSFSCLYFCGSVCYQPLFFFLFSTYGLYRQFWSGGRYVIVFHLFDGERLESMPCL